ncbi:MULTISPECIES: hypothetical protein [Tessaracoccus]|uniref:Uncharacterized protein n=2 Tax=Tessaracoccus TaxID=72763 RepID=A0ABY8Q094_9ACTN|nr:MULTISPECIES: hypothetical protein [Tessaracoccus]QXT61890.1 hypothetical protein KDB89_08820 [Tessaracoccus palaemonis]WGT48179.1 hypothetical protein QH948_05325 [Tessaracoccus sp. T21]
MTFLLEAAASEPLVPSWVMGLIFLCILLGVVAWIIGFGSGRPHSK